MYSTHNGQGHKEHRLYQWYRFLKPPLQNSKSRPSTVVYHTKVGRKIIGWGYFNSLFSLFFLSKHVKTFQMKWKTHRWFCFSFVWDFMTLKFLLVMIIQKVVYLHFMLSPRIFWTFLRFDRKNCKEKTYL